MIEQQNFDVNVLVNDHNFVVELLQNSGYMDFSIMNMIFKKRKPQINSGTKLALNQAILRGNPFMINTLLELGNPNPFTVDKLGKAPIHIAAAKLDMDTFEALIAKGADPMMPDADGNTILHIMAMGQIKDKEYDFIKTMCIRHNLRLTRNKENRTCINIIRANSGQGVLLRGQPNFKLKTCEWFQQRIAQKPNFLDEEGDTDVHKAIKANDLPQLRSLIHQIDKMSGKITPEVINLLEQRNNLGQTAFFTAVDSGSNLIAEFLIEQYPCLDFFAKDTIQGDTALHVACRNKNVEMVQKIFEIKPEKCLAPNFIGQSPFVIATQVQSMELLQIFSAYKKEALLKKDRYGENPLFECARNGNEGIFNWFIGDGNEFYFARGQQNYKG